MNQVKTEFWVSTRKAGEVLDVSPRTIARWIRQGKLNAVKVGRVWRVSLNELRRLMSSET